MKAQGQPPGERSSPLTTMVTMRVSPSLYEVLREAAEHQSLGLSAFVRVAAKSHAMRVLKEKRRAA